MMTKLCAMYKIKNIAFFLFPSWGFDLVPGIDRIVLGDLVYCKEQLIEKEVAASYSRCEGGSSNDIDDSSNVDEISEMDLSVEKEISVKASIQVF